MTDEEPEEGEPETEGSDDEVPDIEDEEQAEFDVDVDPEAIEEEAGAGADDDADEGEDATPSTPDVAPDAGETWGDMYCEGLATTATILRQEMGDGTEISPARARELHLDDYFNEFLDERGKSEDMPPEQALLVGTCIFMMGAVATDSELVGNVVSEVTA